MKNSCRAQSALLLKTLHEIDCPTAFKDNLKIAIQSQFAKLEIFASLLTTNSAELKRRLQSLDDGYRVPLEESTEKGDEHHLSPDKEPDSILTPELFAAIQLGAFFEATDLNEVDSVQRGAELLFEQAQWLDRLYEGAWRFQRTHDVNHFFSEVAAIEPIFYSSAAARWPRRPRRPRRPTKKPNRLIASKHYQCIKKVMQLMAELRRYRELNEPVRPFVFSDNITNLSRNVCAGSLLTITGHGFGGSRPSNIELLFKSEDGCRVVSPTSWSDTRIVVRVPEWAVSGCIGLRDNSVRSQWEDYWRGYAAISRKIATVLRKCKRQTPPEFGPPSFEERFECPPCTEHNYLALGPPVVEFSVNFQNSIVIEPDETVYFKWSVENATQFQISKIAGGIGPAVTRSGSSGPNFFGAEDIVFSVNSDGDAVYELHASNTCGEMIVTVTVRIRKSTKVGVVALEVTQALQTLDIANPSASNQVFLITGKRTVVRAVVDSGLPTTYSSGGALELDAELRITSLDGRFSPITVPPMISPAIIFPLSTFNRESFTTTLNFEIPVQNCTGAVRLEARVKPKMDFSKWSATSSTADVSFRSGGRLTVFVLRVNDTFTQPGGTSLGLAPVTAVTNALAEMRAMFPVAEADVIQSFDGRGDTITTSQDYRLDDFTDSAWDDLLDDLEEAAEEFSDNGEVWCAVIPPLPFLPPIAGRAIEGSLWWHSKAIWESNRAGTPCHEIGHATDCDDLSEDFFGHNQGGTMSTTGSQLRGFDIRTTGPGLTFALPGPRILPPNHGELMSQATFSPTGADRWPSLNRYTEIDKEFRAR